MTLPVNDERVFTLAREDIIHSPRRRHRGFTTGFFVRERWMQAQCRGGFQPTYAQAGHVVSWTAALRRLERAGRLRRIELETARGNPGGHGYALPETS